MEHARVQGWSNAIIQLKTLEKRHCYLVTAAAAFLYSIHIDIIIVLL
jgi:hypothetical protein